MAKVTTLAPIFWPLMEGPSVETPYCCVCGARWPLNRHHVVKRGAGELYRDGVRLPKPTLMLCGSGNASGCHGKAHQGRLHFRYVKQPWKKGWRLLRPQTFGYYDGEPSRGGHWEYLETPEPCKYQEALEMDGWKPVRTGAE